MGLIKTLLQHTWCAPLYFLDFDRGLSYIVKTACLEQHALWTHPGPVPSTELALDITSKTLSGNRLMPTR